ncbi:hypothetical protein GQR58_016297 [Nymphon striatum]|nr:hypothetical protein GQR58_016297 [Nymphon striatum]
MAAKSQEQKKSGKSGKSGNPALIIRLRASCSINLLPACANFFQLMHAIENSVYSQTNEYSGSKVLHCTFTLLIAEIRWLPLYQIIYTVVHCVAHVHHKDMQSAMMSELKSISKTTEITELAIKQLLCTKIQRSRVKGQEQDHRDHRTFLQIKQLLCTKVHRSRVKGKRSAKERIMHSSEGDKCETPLEIHLYITVEDSAADDEDEY